MKKNKSQWRGKRATAKQGGGRVVLRPPRLRLRALFDIPRDVAATIEGVMGKVPIPPSTPEKALFHFEVAVVERALNLLKSVMLLCGEGHWEVATAANRQLFELLINMEHIAAQPDRGRATKQYMKFGLMQTLELAVASLEYSQATNRPVNTADLAGLKQALADNFDEFRSKKNGRRNQTWSGKNARQLAELSGEKSRTDQYRLLYTPWSEQTHAAPGALLGRILQVDVTEDDLLANDDVHITEAVALSIELVVAVMDTLPAIPQIPHAKRDEWLSALSREMSRYPRLVPLIRQRQTP